MDLGLSTQACFVKLYTKYTTQRGVEGGWGMRSGGRFPSAGEKDQRSRNRRGETKAHRMVSQVNRRIPWIHHPEHDNRLVASSGKV